MYDPKLNAPAMTGLAYSTWPPADEMLVHVTIGHCVSLGWCVVYSPVGIDWLGGGNWCNEPWRFQPMDEYGDEIIALVVERRARLIEALDTES